MYSKIANPKTGRMVSVNGKLGQEILRNYLNVLEGGMPPCRGKKEKVCKVRDQCNWIQPVFGSGKTISKGECVKKEEEEDSDWDGVRPLTLPASAYTSVGEVHH